MKKLLLSLMLINLMAYGMDKDKACRKWVPYVKKSIESHNRGLISNQRHLDETLKYVAMYAYDREWICESITSDTTYVEVPGIFSHGIEKVIKIKTRQQCVNEFISHLHGRAYEEQAAALINTFTDNCLEYKNDY